MTPGLGFWRGYGDDPGDHRGGQHRARWSAIGIGMTYSMLGSWGYSRSRTTTALVSGVWNSFIKLGMPVLALALVLLQGGAGGGRVLAAVVGIAGLVTAIVVFALMLRSEEQARRFGLLAGRVATRLLRMVRRGPVSGWELATVKFRNRTIDLVSHRWISITVWSLVSHLSLYAVLLVALRDVGVSNEVGWAEVLAVFAFARLVTAILITPVGLAGRGGPDRRADRRRRQLAGGRRGADLPGAHLGAADLGRHRLLCVVATPGMDDPGPRPPARGRRTPVAATTADQCFRLRQPGPPRSQRPARAGCRRGHGPHPGPSRERRDGQADRGPAQHVQRVVRPKYTRATAFRVASTNATTVQRRGSTGASSPAMAKVMMACPETKLSPAGCTHAVPHQGPWSPAAPAAPVA